MRTFTIALLGVLALAGSAVAQADGASLANRSFQSLYTVTARGMNVGDFNYSFMQNGSNYQANAQRRLSGFARLMMHNSQDFTYSARGSVGGDGALHPQEYQHQGGKNHRLVRATFTGEDIVTTAQPRMGMGHPPATQAQKRGAIDQLSAIASMVVAQGDPCGRTVRVYMDGRSRFDFVMGPSAPTNVNTAAYRGPALRCRVHFQPIAGFSDPQQPADLTFVFARTPSGMFAPVHVEMPSDDAGIILLDARSLSVNGANLR